MPQRLAINFGIFTGTTKKTLFILGKRMHLNTTNFSLYGEYDSVECLGDSPMPTYGYSKANRPD